MHVYVRVCITDCVSYSVNNHFGTTKCLLDCKFYHRKRCDFINSSENRLESCLGDGFVYNENNW